MPYTADEIMPYGQQSDMQNRILNCLHPMINIAYNLEIIAEQSSKQTELLFRILEKQREKNTFRY